MTALPNWLTEAFAVPQPAAPAPRRRRTKAEMGVVLAPAPAPTPAPPAAPQVPVSTPLEAVPVPAVGTLPAEVKPLERAQRLDKLLDKSIDVAEEILEMPFLQPGDEDFRAVLSTKAEMAKGIMSVALKADENKFRERSADRLASLLEHVLKAEQGAVIEGGHRPVE